MGHWIVFWPGYSREMLSTIWLQTMSGSIVEVVEPSMHQEHRSIISRVENSAIRKSDQSIKTLQTEVGV